MILDKIVAEKLKEVAQAKQECAQDDLAAKAASCAGERRSFKQAIAEPGKLKLIAEIKKASPSGGLLRADFDPVQIARTYASAGAAALSILTDRKFFQGDIGYLEAVRQVVKLPILRKDFIIDRYQIYQSVCNGADCILLIARFLTAEQLKDFCALSAQVNLDVVCEVYDSEDLEKALAADAEIIGINNRNLDTLEVDLQVSAKLVGKIPKDKIVISESAIKSVSDVKFLQALGVNAVLVGETFMRSADIAAKIKELMGA